MELFTNSDDFPEHITPFPASTGFVYEHQTAAISSPEIKLCPSFPPQKLRPIRSNGKNPMEYSESVMNAQSVQLIQNGGLSGNILGGTSPEVGFMNHQQICNLSRDPKDCCDALCDGGFMSAGNGLWSSETAAAAIQEVRSKFETEPRNGNGDAETRATEPETSSSWDSDSLENNPVKRKRKRKAKKGLELFLENLTEKLMQKQEQMHNQLIELIEMKEKERVLREEAWKQQEMERAKREEAFRAQETSRSLAIISFIQSAFGDGFQIPKPLRAAYPVEDEGEIHNQSVVNYNPAEAQYKDDTNDKRWPETEVQTKYDLNNKRWPKSEVQALISLRTALDHKFSSMGSKSSVWEEISVGLARMGYDRTAKKCKEKWENMNKYFKRSMEEGKTRSENAKTCPYFQELEMLYKSGPRNPSLSITNGESEDKNG